MQAEMNAENLCGGVLAIVATNPLCVVMFCGEEQPKVVGAVKG
jgi:hypothetical protein